MLIVCLLSKAQHILHSDVANKAKGFSHHNESSGIDGHFHEYVRICANTTGFAMTNTRPSFCFQNWELEMEMSQTLLSRRVLTPYIAARDEFITIDCGAAQGWYSILWSQLGIQVLAFEPGDVRPIQQAMKLNRGGEHNIKVHNLGLGKVNENAQQSGTAQTNTDETQAGLVASTVATFLPANRSVAMIKIDIEGTEIFVLEDIWNVSTSRSVPLFHNILVEFTPKWWPGGVEHGAKVLDLFVKEGWQFVSSPWSEHAFRVGKAPFGLAPNNVEVDWNTEPLLFAQRIPPAQVIEYILSIKYQRDIWMQHPHARFPLDLAKNEVSDILCPDADEWRYARMPRYLQDPKNIDGCYDFYHKEHTGLQVPAP